MGALRIEFEGAVYHIAARGNHREHIYRDAMDRQRFIALMQRYKERYSVNIYAYVLMDNHYQMVIETPLGNLTKFMLGLQSHYTNYR